MASKGSIFLFEISLEDLKSYVQCTKFRIKCQFKDVFDVQLKNPNELYAESLLPKKKKGKRKKYKKAISSCQAAIVITDVESLICRMIQYPIELIIWSKDNSCALGLSEIEWNPLFINYLQQPNVENLPPKSFKGTYDVFDEYTSRRMAIVTLKIRLTQLKEIPEELKPPLNGAGCQPLPCETELIAENTGIIKTIYSGGKQKLNKSSRDTNNSYTNNSKATIPPKKEMTKVKEDDDVLSNLNVKFTNTRKVEKSIANLVRSETDLDSNKLIALRKSKSYSAIEVKERLNTLNKIFKELNPPLKYPLSNQVYWVEYFTVANDSVPSSRSPSPDTKTHSSDKTMQSGKDYFQFKVCGSACKTEGVDKNPCFENICSTDLPAEAARLINVRKCTSIVECDNKRERGSLLPVHKPIFLKMPQAIYEKVEEVEGGVEAKMKVGDDPCFCTCECTFGFVKRSTFCKVCGGFEKVGEDIAEITKDPFPCPIYYNLDQKKKRKEETSPASRKSKSAKDVASDKTIGSISDKKSETEKGETERKKKKVVDERFKFNYGYKAPHIGHEFCGIMTCAGLLSNVPKNMGWLWTATNVPGLKFRPTYRPGATNRKVVRMLNAVKNPDLLLARKRKKEASKYKRPLKRPLLIVEKKDGEYTVTMETMKTFAKPRYPNQHPYEDKPLVTYTIGRTEEENRERARKKAREQRRLERYQREFIQSTFRDMCKEICVNTYRQALQFLPHSEDPPCSCFPALPGPDKIDLDHSCSCSDASKSSLGSATDDDEWIVEFTPPVAYFNPGFKGRKIVKVDHSTQYTHHDFRVKLLDRFGNPVPRFFKYIDGRTMCSDLGGFWSPENKWLEINVDGYIGPDERWAPNTFIGPNGEQVDAETGKFQATNGDWLVVGVDGYVDDTEKWRFYSRTHGGGGRGGVTGGVGGVVGATRRNSKKDDGSCKKIVNKVSGDKKRPKELAKLSEGTWSCFGDASPKHLSEMGIIGHGHDRQLLLSKLQKMAAQGERIKIPHVPRIPPHPRSKKGKHRHSSLDYDSERSKCTHHTTSGKDIVAVDGRGNKTYFKLKAYKNPRPKERLVTLEKEGFSLSSFHVPCFSSFINSEVMRQQQIQHILRHNERVLKNTGAQRDDGWRPGAISKRLLRKLNAAKLRTSEVEKTKPTKRSKKRHEDKPTLIVAKKAGEYFVELQVDVEAEGNYEQYKPLIYKIASANNEEKVRKRKRREQSLVKETFNKVFTDPFHPEVCEQTCLKAYRQAMGIPPYNPNQPKCICPEEVEEMDTETVESDESSDYSDLDLEIHFTPPIAYNV